MDAGPWSERYYTLTKKVQVTEWLEIFFLDKLRAYRSESSIMGDTMITSTDHVNEKKQMS